MPYQLNKFYYIIECNIKDNNSKCCTCSCRNFNICLKMDCCCNLIVKILSLSKIMRIFFQIGEIYFSLLVLGIYLETITIFITGANIIYIHPLLILIFWMPFLNFISIFPIVIQFWEAIKLRYLKKKCPLCCSFGNNGEENVCEFILDIIFLIMEILYIYSFIIYNSNPNLFEQLNLFTLIIMPGLKSVIIFLLNAIVGIRIIFGRIIIICKIKKCQNLELDDRKLLHYDNFEENIESNKSPEYFDEFQPVALLMYSDNIERDNYCSCDCWYFCIKCIYLLLFFYLL